MESMYETGRMVCSEYINPVEFLKTASDNFIFPNEPFDDSTIEKNIKDLMGIDISDEQFNQLTKSCCPLQLNGAIDNWNHPKHQISSVSLFKPIEITPESLIFKCVQKGKELRESKGYSYKTWLKYRSEKFPNNVAVSNEPPNLVPGKEILIRIRVYHPFNYVNAMKASSNPKFYHELIVLGNDTLDVLRDKILCSNDLMSNVDISENPESERRVVVKDNFKSGFLFIDGTFYNDFRDPSSKDYSECILEWAKTKPGIGPFNTARMEDTKFNQLRIQLGCPQVYQHIGNCEHLFIFSDMEVLQPSDDCHSSSYPIYKAVSMRHARYCTMCGNFVAKWKVEENERVPFDPAYFCDGCFFSYNYVNGKKVGHFKAFPYYDSVVAM